MGSSDKRLLSGDLAWGIMSDHSKRLLGDIQDLIEQPARLEPDCAEASEVAIKIEMLNALHQAGLMRSHPSPEIVVAWRDQFFAVFDEFAKDNWQTDAAREIRKEFNSPFNKLIRICRKNAWSLIEI